MKRPQSRSKYDIIPSATLVHEEVLTTSYQTVIEIRDNTLLIDQSNGMHLFIFDGEKIIKHQPLDLGTNFIEVNNLLMGTRYEYQVIGIYDDYSGDGKKANPMINSEFTTQDGYFVESIKSTKIVFLDSNIDADASFKHAKLYLNASLLDTLYSIDELIFNGLLSDNEYVIKLAYYYLNNNVSVEKIVEVRVHTLSKVIPSISIDEVLEDTRTIKYVISENDIDETNTMILVNLYQNDKIVNSLSSLEDEFLIFI